MTYRNVPLDPFHPKVMTLPESGCWLWIGATSKRGYGHVSQGRGNPVKRAHRVSWEQHRGDIPKGMLVCHKCDVGICINPDHLFLGTSADNTSDMIAKGRNRVGDRHPNRMYPERLPRGSKHRSAKLSEEDVREILLGKESLSAAGRRFGVTKTAISMIRRRKLWRHVQ